MASKLLKCLTCGGNVSETARACPHCGERKFAVKKTHGKLKALLILALLAAMFFILNGLKERIYGYNQSRISPSAEMTAE